MSQPPVTLKSESKLWQVVKAILHKAASTRAWIVQSYSPNGAYVHTHTHTHTFNGPLSGTTRVSQYQKGKTNLDFSEERDSEWQWHRLDHMQVCTSLQTDNHANTSLLSFFTGRMPFLPPNQQRQSTEGKKWRLCAPLSNTRFLAGAHTSLPLNCILIGSAEFAGLTGVPNTQADRLTDDGT